jgi:hypothetical protein
VKLRDKGFASIIAYSFLAHSSRCQISQFGFAQERDWALYLATQRLVLRSPLSWCLYRTLRSVARSLPSGAQLWPLRPSRLSLSQCASDRQMGINVAGEMLAKLSVQLLWGSRVAEGRGESLVFPLFRSRGNHVDFQLFINARHGNQQRALLEQWH